MAIKQLIRTKTGEKTVSLTPIKAIRAQCLECCGWKASEVRKCSSDKCSLYGYRLGNLK